MAFISLSSFHNSVMFSKDRFRVKGGQRTRFLPQPAHQILRISKLHLGEHGPIHIPIVPPFTRAHNSRRDVVYAVVSIAAPLTTIVEWIL